MRQHPSRPRSVPRLDHQPLRASAPRSALLEHRRRSPTATTRSQHPQYVTCPEPDRALVRQALGSGLVAARQQPVLPYRSGFSPCETPRLRDASLGDQRHRRVLEHLEVALDALAPSGPPGSAAPLSEPVAEDPQRERPLQRSMGVFRVFVNSITV